MKHAPSSCVIHGAPKRGKIINAVGEKKNSKTNTKQDNRLAPKRRSRMHTRYQKGKIYVQSKQTNTAK